MATEFDTKAEILSDLWLNYRSEETFADFVEYNDLGLPLAYAVSFELATLKEEGKDMIEETFDLLLAALDTDDIGFASLVDLLGVDEEEE